MPSAKEVIQARLEAMEDLLLREHSSPENEAYFTGKRDAYETAIKDIEHCNDNHEQL